MKKFSLLFVSILIFGCSSDSDSKSNIDNGIKLTKITTTYKDGKNDVSNFIYENGRLSKIEYIDNRAFIDIVN